MPMRFVLLRHQMPDDYPRSSHWDLLLERDETCWTWALDQLPSGFADDGPSVVEGLRLKDHRKHYLDYEGPITDDRGSVLQVCSGTCEWIETSDSRIGVRLEFNDRSLELLLTLLSDHTWKLNCK